MLSKIDIDGCMNASVLGLNEGLVKLTRVASDTMLRDVVATRFPGTSGSGSSEKVNEVGLKTLRASLSGETVLHGDLDTTSGILIAWKTLLVMLNPISVVPDEDWGSKLEESSGSSVTESSKVEFKAVNAKWGSGVTDEWVFTAGIWSSKTNSDHSFSKI